jgi:serine/threonine protein kinase/Tol biopolymer transport system component
MASERSARLSHLYHAALSRRPEDRDAFLNEACADDEALRREVESLLRYESDAPEFLENPALAGLPSDLAGMTQMLGRDFGPYRILAPLGKGGMGEVYRGLDSKLGREVALKFLPPHFIADPERRVRFAREARLLATLNHPNIGSIYGLHEANDLSALVLELVEGPTLADRLQQGAMKIVEALAVARQIAEALEAAHEKGIVHRDLKPANVVLQKSAASGPSGSDIRAKVLDFGLAKPIVLLGPDTPTVHTAGSFERTAEGRIVGTPAYMSPEQTRGHDVGKRTDIWAFGCVLFEMLSGRRPFAANTTSETFARVLEHEPDWTVLPASTPDAARKLLKRCLEKDLSRRLRDIGDARLELEDAHAAASPVGAGSLSNNAGSRPRARLTWRTLAVVVASLIGGSVVAGAWLLQRRGPALSNPIENALFSRITNFEGTERSAAVSRDGRFVAFRSDRDGPFDVWLTQIGIGQFVNVTKGIDDEFSTEIPSGGFSGDGSGIWLSGGIGRRLRILPLMGGTPHPFLPDNTVSVAWSPDGTRVVYHLQDDGDSMFVADRTGANARLVYRRKANEHNHFPIWSVDGQWIYFTSGTPETKEMDIWRISPEGGSPERLTRHNSDVVYPTPIDSTTLVYVADDERRSGPALWALDVVRKLTRRLSFGVEQYMSISATADGSRLVATVSNPSATLWSIPILTDRLAEEADVKPLHLPTAQSKAPRFGAGSLFYLSSIGAGDGVWRFDDPQSTEIWKGADGSVLAPPDVSRDGQKVVIVLRRNGKLQLHVLSAEGGELRALADSIDVRGAAAWSPDGKWIVVRGNEHESPGLFKVPADGGNPIRLTTGVALNPIWSPDGNLIAYAGRNVSIYTPLLGVRPDGTPVKLPPIKFRREGERIRFTPDGKALIYMQGDLRAQDFWSLDLTTMKTRPLTRLTQRDTMLTFDVTPDGKQIVFDRLRDNSDIVLIDRQRSASR